jgi:hypothetical protein
MYDNFGLAKLIGMQIKYVNIIYGSNDCEMVIRALEKHAHSIFHLSLVTFDNGSFHSYNLLPKLINMQSLILYVNIY